MPRFPSFIDDASKKWALVLFDWDGCTAIIESKRLVGKEDRKVGSKFKLSFDGRLHEVEILGFGYEDHHLHAKDNQWDRSTRAKAIAAVRDARELTRRGKYGGYLDIHDSDNSDEDEEAIFSPDTSHLRTRANPNCRKTTSKKQPQKTSTPSTQQQAQQKPQETQRQHIEGTNGRSVTILYEGSGDYEGHSSPKRQPCSFEDLTSDQVDIILNQVESAQKNLISTMTMTDDIVIVQSEEDIASLCKDCNGTHHSQTSVQTQLKDIKSSQKALEKKVDSLLEILTTFVKKQETCVTIDLNTSSFVIEPESTPPSKVTKALNNILTTSVMSTTAQDTSAAKIPFNTSILDNTCDTSTTRNNLTTGRTTMTGNILTTLRASTTSKNSIDSTTGNNSTSNTQTTSKTLRGSTPSTGNLTGRTLSTDNSMGSTPSTDNSTGCTLSTDNSMGSTPSTDNSTCRALSTDNSMGSTPSIVNSTGPTLSTDNSMGSTPSTGNSTGRTLSTDNSMGSTPSTDNSTGRTLSTDNSMSSTPSTGNSTGRNLSTDNSMGSIQMSGKTSTTNTPLTGHNSLGNTLIGSTPSMFITSSMVGTSTPVTSFETTSREEPRVLLMDASNDELPPPVCETIAELVLVEENEENVAPSLESRFANQMKKPRLQRMKRFPSPCKANAITTYIRSSEDVEPGNYEILVCPDVLMEIKDRSCSDGNFLLNTARRIFKEEELEGKNYSGRKGRPGISPRRKHALQHAFAEHCSSNIDDFKRAVIALNSGIRGMAFK